MKTVEKFVESVTPNTPDPKVAQGASPDQKNLNSELADQLIALLNQAKSIAGQIAALKEKAVAHASVEYNLNGMSDKFSKSVILPGNTTPGVEVSFKNQYGIDDKVAAVLKALLGKNFKDLFEKEVTCSISFNSEAALKRFIASLNEDDLKQVATSVKYVPAKDADQCQFGKGFDAKAREIMQNCQTVSVGAAKKEYE